MNALRGLAFLLLLQSLGELLSRGLSLPFPGPVIGMLLLLLARRGPCKSTRTPALMPGWHWACR